MNRHNTNLLDEEFGAWEAMMQRHPLSAGRRDGMVELRPLASPADQLASDALQERWAQQYLKEEFSRIGFTKVDGPFNRGPDYKVLYKRRWHLAEVETRWRNYLNHRHHLNPAFDGVEFLVLLSAESPPQEVREYLPPRIVHIDRQHFLAWYEKAARPELLGEEFGARVAIVAGAMQHHWTTICSDVDREMAVCPDCDGCAYFGYGCFSEAPPFYQDLAAKFLVSTGLTNTGRADISKINAASVERFVEEHPPGDD